MDDCGGFPCPCAGVSHTQASDSCRQAKQNQGLQHTINFLITWRAAKQLCIKSSWQFRYWLFNVRPPYRVCKQGDRLPLQACCFVRNQFPSLSHPPSSLSHPPPPPPSSLPHPPSSLPHPLPSLTHPLPSLPHPLPSLPQPPSPLPRRTLPGRHQSSGPLCRHSNRPKQQNTQRVRLTTLLSPPTLQSGTFFYYSLLRAKPLSLVWQWAERSAHSNTVLSTGGGGEASPQTLQLPPPPPQKKILPIKFK